MTMREAEEQRHGSVRGRFALAFLLAGLSSSAFPAGPGGSTEQIYTCTDASGKRHTADRLIAECIGREQRVLSRDGSVLRIIPPTLTPAERAEVEAREQRKAAEREKQQELVRRDRNLLQRYPDEASHAKARAEALETARNAIAQSQERLAQLGAQRKPLDSEREFYVGKPLPPDLKQKVDANDAAVEAQRALMQNQQAEIGRINASFDAELTRLKKLWAGAAPGSLGPMETTIVSAPAPAPARR